MKTSFLMVLPILALATACGGDSTSGTDGGKDGSTTDAPSNDGAPNDGGANDASTDAAQDGGLGAGDTCDLQNDQCGAGLKCCGGGAQLDDGGTGHCIKPTDGGTCPPIP